MASFNDLAYDWSTLCQDPECWTTSVLLVNTVVVRSWRSFLQIVGNYTDLQLAAELGKTLLERNKELEVALSQHLNVIEDQAQEIEYLTKQTVALREVNDSRLRIYEQLEVSIQDLERANHRLAVEHTSDKKQIKSLTSNLEAIEQKNDDLIKTIDDLKAQLEIAKRKSERRPETKAETIETVFAPTTPTKKTQNDIVENVRFSTPHKTAAPPPLEFTKDHEDLLRLSDDLRESKVTLCQEQRRVSELEEQLASIIKENNRLQEQLRDVHRREDEPKSMHEEFSILEEVRQGQLCIRCLRGVERAPDEMSSFMDGDDDDRSGISSLINHGATSDAALELVKEQQRNTIGKFHTDKEKILSSLWSNNQDNQNNPYRDLVEKYEALLEVQMSQVNNIRKNKQPTTNATPGPISLQDELQTSGDFSQFSTKDTDEESGQGDKNKQTQNGRKKFRRTPDFSEAETSSSGFSDETSNKATQTEKDRPGSFLCTIADGEDYRFSIYEDANTMDSRFRNRPEYRELFKEIFTILKKAAEHKDEGETLPLLDDAIPTGIKVPPVTPANEDLPGFLTDDTQSVMSSVISEQSITFCEPTPSDMNVTLKENTVIKPEVEVQEQNKENKPNEKCNEKSVQPVVRQPLDFIASTKKKSRHRRKHSQDRQGAESPIFPSPPKIIYQKSSKKRRDYKPIEASPLVKTPQESKAEWNGSTLQFYNRQTNSPTPSTSSRTGKIYQSWNPETDSWNIKQNSASQEIHKLRKLELSYAEVLRSADKGKNRRKKHQ